MHNKNGDSMNILITGALSGIGYKTGVELANLGYYVYLTCETENQLNLLKEKIKGKSNLECFKMDITNDNDRNKLNELEIDVFISNSAIGQGGSILDTDISKIRQCYEVNVFSNIETIKVILNNMLKKDKGRIIVISSMISNISLPFFGIYGSSKASITSLTKSLRKEVKYLTDNIKIIIVEPGLYKTGFNKVMIDNKLDNKNSPFLKYENKLIENEILIFDILEKKKLDTISKKIIKSVEDKYPKQIYRAPLLQNIFLKIYIKLLKK